MSEQLTNNEVSEVRDAPDAERAPKNEALQRAITILGNQTKLADAIGRKPQAVSDVVRRGGECPGEWCYPIELATRAAHAEKGCGFVTCHQLRPDLYPKGFVVT